MSLKETIEGLNLKGTSPTRRIITLEIDGIGNYVRTIGALKQEFGEGLRMGIQRGLMRKRPRKGTNSVEVIEAFVGIESTNDKQD